jgi:DNA-binding transcriptional ArsR family regulator
MQITERSRDVGQLADLFSALAHEQRLQILLVLRFRGGRMTAGDIAQRFACTWPTTTRHLKVLIAAGLVQVEKQGRERHYLLNADLLRSDIQAWLTWFEDR